MNNMPESKTTFHPIIARLFFCSISLLMCIVITGCSLEKDERTVQIQQLMQPNETNDLPVWRDVYSNSVQDDVYSPRGHVESLP